MIDLFQYPKPVTVCLLIVALIVKRLWAKRVPLPPGPKGYPIVGNVFDLGRDTPWINFSNLAKKYGDIVYVEALGTKMLILSSLRRTTDLLEGRSLNYSDRPDWPMLNGQMKYDIFFGLRRYGTEWRKQRKMLHQLFHPLAVSRYHPFMAREKVRYLKDILESPGRFKLHTRAYFSRIIVKSTYGIELMNDDDPYLTMMEGVSEGLSVAGIPGTFLVDLIPALQYVPRWVPGTGWRRVADYYKQKAMDAKDVPFEGVLKAMKSGTAEPCLVTELVEALPPLHDPKRKEEEEEIIRQCAVSIYFGGSDTSLGSGMTFILAMALHPEVQKRAQAEIDSVVGQGRLPDFDDRPKLVYINAVLMELFRWHQLTPAGVPHCTTEDDFYNGYFIPKDTVVIGNVWHILHDEATFPDPFTFNPDRFIKDGQINKDIMDPFLTAFGFGRRICPGRHMSLDSLYILITSLLSVFDITAPKDGAGKPLTKATFSGAFLLLPDPFKCD